MSSMNGTEGKAAMSNLMRDAASKLHATISMCVERGSQMLTLLEAKGFFLVCLYSPGERRFLETSIFTGICDAWVDLATKLGIYHSLPGNVLAG